MSDIHALSGAYAMDALDDLERASFDHHLAICPSCRDEVASLQEGAALMGDGLELSPPVMLREKVMAEIATFRPLPPVVERPDVDRTVVPLRRRLPALAAAAAVVAAIGIGITVVRPGDDDAGRPPSTTAQVLRADDAEKQTFTMENGARAVLVRSVALNKAVLTVEGMAPLPDGKVYELWLQHDDQMVAAGFLPSGVDDTVLLTGDAAAASAVGITTEPEGGSPEPNLESAVLLPFDKA